MPISTPDKWLLEYSNDKHHFLHVLNHLFIPSIEKAGLEPITPIAKGSELIHSEIIKNIESSDLVLCDMSILNPNVFFEFGIRTALNKPICLIKDDITENVPFDTAIINTHTYSSALNPWNLEKEIDDLTSHVKESLERSNGSNSLWKYFSINSIAKTIETEPDTDVRIDLLTKQIETLRKELLGGNKPMEFPKISLELKTFIIHVLENNGAKLLAFNRKRYTLELEIDEDINDFATDELFQIVRQEGFKQLMISMPKGGISLQ